MGCQHRVPHLLDGFALERRVLGSLGSLLSPSSHSILAELQGAGWVRNGGDAPIVF